MLFFDIQSHKRARAENISKSVIYSGFTPVLLAYTEKTGFSQFTSEQIVGTLLISLTLLLTGILFHFRHIRMASENKLKQLSKYELHIKMLGDSSASVTAFQLIQDNKGEFAFSFLSKGYEKVLGLERRHIMRDASLFFEHLYEEDIPKLQEAYKEASTNLSPTDLTIRILDARGNLKWLHINALPFHENNDLIWVGFAQDVTLRKEIETKLEGEKENFQNLFETIDDFLIICDMNGSIMHTNPVVNNTLGYTDNDLITTSLFEMFPKSLRDKVYKMIAIMQTEDTCACGLPIKVKGGDTIPVELKFFKGMWKNRPSIFIVGRDVASRRNTEAKLRESQEKLQLIMNTIPMSVFWKDKDSIYLGCNKAFGKECGLDSIEAVIGKSPYDLFDEETATKIINQDQQVILSNEPVMNFLHSYAKSKNEVGWRETNSIPLHDEHGHAVGILGMWRDVTDQNQAEERLKRTLEDMERFNQLMRGRELRTLELKAEVNTLQKELGRPIKYRTTTDHF